MLAREREREGFSVLIIARNDIADKRRSVLLLV